MGEWKNLGRYDQNVRIQNLGINDRTIWLCRNFLEQLRFNQVVRKLDLDYSPYFGSLEGCKALGEVIGSSKTLQELSLKGVGMSGDGLGKIIRGLLGNPNSGLVKLDISSNANLGSTGAKVVEELLLGKLPRLRLNIVGAGFGAEDMAVVARAVAENNTLEELLCGGGCGTIQPDRDGPLGLILKALTPVERNGDRGGKSNATLQVLRMNYEYEKGLAENLARMLSRNYSLQGIALWNFPFDREDWAKVWKALRHNKSLHTLFLNGCGQGLRDASGDLMDLLEANGTIKHIVMTETELEAEPPTQVKQLLDRNKRLAEAQVEELKVIMKKLESNEWNWESPSEREEAAKLGRKLGEWATSSSTAAVVPIIYIEMAMKRLRELMLMLRADKQNQVAKSMMQDIVLKLADQSSPKLDVLCVAILLEYARICNLTGDFQNAVESCEKGISLIATWNEKDVNANCHFQIYLGHAYLNLSNGPLAEKALRDARSSLADFSSGPAENYSDNVAPNTESPRHIDQLRTMAGIEALEGRVTLLEYRFFTPEIQRKHIVVAAKHLQKSLAGLTTICGSGSASLTDKEDWIHVALGFSEAMGHVPGGLLVARDICKQALLEAESVGFSPGIARALLQCGCLAAHARQFEEAERYIRNGLLQANQNGHHGPLLFERLYMLLGTILQGRGGSYLPQAEGAFRQSIKSWSESLNSTRTSDFRIMTLERGKGIFAHLQSCIYEIYVKAEENEKARKAREALVVAEQGRSLDLMLTLHDPWMSRTTDKELLCDDYVGVMDWEAFDTDGEYAWRHLESCMAICTDAIKEQNPEVHRVTFIEYTLTESQILIWVLHSHGTEKQGSVQTASTVPLMYNVDVKEAFEEIISEEGPDLKEYFSQLYGPEKYAAKYNAAILESHRVESVQLFEVYVQTLLRDSSPKKYLRQLYDLLIKPIDSADNLVAGEPLIFIPHEGLSFVPYAGLLSQYKKHLIEEHPVGVASSLRTLGWATKQYAFLNARPTTLPDKKQMLLVADPFPLGENHVSLEDSIEEVRNIETMLSDQYSTKVLVREDASLESVVAHMKTASWYHIACHGEVTAQYPQGVLFLGARTDITEGAQSQGAAISSGVSEERRRGFLTPEIMAKDLGSTSTARAAVLSACKVGLGKNTAEGLLGLSRAFMLAGVPLVLAPLRPVDSRKCSAFMQHLYKKLVGGETLMFALRRTMVDVIHKRVQVVAARHEDEDGDDEEDDDEEEEIEWQVWDWAAWLAVGFPGVCLTSLIAAPNVGNPTRNVQATSPNDGNFSQCEARLRCWEPYT